MVYFWRYNAAGNKISAIITRPSQSEDLQLVHVANGQPLRLQFGPRDVGDLIICLVFKQRRLAFQPTSSAGKVPNVGLAVVAYRAHVDG